MNGRGVVHSQEWLAGRRGREGPAMGFSLGKNFKPIILVPPSSQKF
jgi:hypothetical protein